MIDLTKLTVINLDGTETVIEFAKNLAQVIFQSTQSVGEHALSLELYKTGQIDDTQENRDIVTKYTEQYFVAYVQIALKQKLDENN